MTEEFIEEYNEYFNTNEEIWNENLNKLINYIKENNKLPSKENNNTKSLGSWLGTQKQKYKNNIEIIKNEEIKKKWIEFIKEYDKYFS